MKGARPELTQQRAHLFDVMSYVIEQVKNERRECVHLLSGTRYVIDYINDMRKDLTAP